MTTKITQTNLDQYVGKIVMLSCTVGLIIDRLEGRLSKNAGLCWYALELADGQRILFSWGEFEVTHYGVLHVTIH